jgi:hypothetical protein
VSREGIEGDEGKDLGPDFVAFVPFARLLPSAFLMLGFAEGRGHKSTKGAKVDEMCLGVVSSVVDFGFLWAGYPRPRGVGDEWGNAG